jgi:hypothetical protein
MRVALIDKCITDQSETTQLFNYRVKLSNHRQPQGTQDLFVFKLVQNIYFQSLIYTIIRIFIIFER